MINQEEQQKLAERLKSMPKEIRDEAIIALGGFASGFLSGYEAAKNEERPA